MDDAAMPLLAGLSDPAFRPFVVSGGVVLAIALCELIGLVIGVGFFDLVEDMLPIDDLPGDGGFFSWLGIGEVPFMVILIVVLALFSSVGIALQSVALALLAVPVDPALLSLVALAGALPVSGWCARMLAAWIPSVESSGIDSAELVGSSGRIVQGRACGQRAAEAHVRDASGASHWIRVRAERGEVIECDAPVRIVGRCRGVVFVARRTDLACADESNCFRSTMGTREEP